MKRVLLSSSSFKEVKLKQAKKKGLSKGLLLAGACASLAVPAQTAENKIEVDTSPWGIALGAEDAGRYPDFNPMLQDAGISWIRYFAEWKSIQPKRGVWDWSWSDKFLADTRARNISVAGIFLYFAPWASADGKDTRAFPVKDMAFFREYVRETAGRYQKEIRYWEVWNEMNSPAFNRRGTTRDYAEMVRAAYQEVKKIDPGIKVGLTVAAHDIRWLDQAIKDGAADHFDYVCVHPYDSVRMVFGSETSFLALRGSVRKMLDENKQRKDLEIWISEIGLTTTEEPEELQRQAEALVKAYVLGAVQGFEKIFWFEAMGPVYGKGVHAIINEKKKPYPSYHALSAMTGALGRNPRYIGWLNLGGDSYGFVFESPETGVSLVLWGARPGVRIKLVAPVTLTDIQGKSRKLAAKTELTLTSSPLFIRDILEPLVVAAKASRSKPFPWNPDYRWADEVSVQLGAVNHEKGLRQGNNDPRPDGITIPGTYQGSSYRGTDLGNKRPFMYFEVDRSFMDWGDTGCEITVVARRADPDVPSTIALVYESETGYHEFGKRSFWPGMNAELIRESESYREPEIWHLENKEGWQEKTWRIRDANFIGKWGWNFQINVESSPGDVRVKEVTVKRHPQKKAAL